jgi:hypothetical protein
MLKDSFFTFMSSCSHIWLNYFLNDHHFGYITKPLKKNHGNSLLEPRTFWNVPRIPVTLLGEYEIGPLTNGFKPSGAHIRCLMLSEIQRSLPSLFCQFCDIAKVLMIDRNIKFVAKYESKICSTSL